MYNILLVEDEESIRKFVKINLEREKYNVYEAESAETALEFTKKTDFDIAILDIMLPNMDGIELCQILRRKFEDMGIIMLTAKSQDVDKILGLESGADDYITKPFNPLELVLRVKSLIRRINEKNGSADSEIIECGQFKIEVSNKKFFKDTKELTLTPTEYLIMKYFLKNPNKIISRDEILKMVWGDEFYGDPKIVDVNIRRLRKKIEVDSSEPEFILTIWGRGYKLKNA